MVLGGTFGKVEPGGNLPVGQPLGHQLGHLALTRRQSDDRIGFAQLLDQVARPSDDRGHAERRGLLGASHSEGTRPDDVAGSTAPRQGFGQLALCLDVECHGPVHGACLGGLLEVDDRLVEQTEMPGRLPQPQLGRTGVGDLAGAAYHMVTPVGR